MSEHKRQSNLNTLQKIGLPLAAIASLAVLSACGEKDGSSTKPSTTISKDSAPSKSATPTLEAVSDEIVNLTGFENSEQALAVGQEVEAVTDEGSSYKTGVTDLYNAIKNDTVGEYAEQRAIDKDEVEANITALTNILDKYGNGFTYTDADKVIMNEYLYYTPDDTVKRYKALLFLLVQFRSHPDYESSVPNSTQPASIVTNDQLSTPYGLGYVSKEVVLSKSANQAEEDSRQYFLPSNDPNKLNGFLNDWRILKEGFIEKGMNPNLAEKMYQFNVAIDTERTIALENIT